MPQVTASLVPPPLNTFLTKPTITACAYTGERLTFPVNLNVRVLARDWTAPRSMPTTEEAVIQGHVVSLLPREIIGFKARTFQDSCRKVWMIAQWTSTSAPTAVNTGKGATPMGQE